MTDVANPANLCRPGLLMPITDERPAMLTAMPEEEPERLVSTKRAADALNISTRTLHRWHVAGIVHATERTAGGHFRWSVQDLRRQVRAYQERRNPDAGPPFAPGLTDAPKHPEEPR